MRRILFGCVSLLAIAVLGCGGDEPATVYADMQWAMRCGEFGMCSGLPDRSILGLNGEMDQDIRCSANESGGQYIFNIRAFGLADPEDEFGIVIRGLAVTTSGGGVIGSTCEIEVEEGGNKFEGRCGATMMTSEVQPCFISPLVIADSAAGPTVTFTAQCSDLPLEADATIKRELTGPGSATSPATFQITSCSGL
jgi:hypothetical protein